jgi:hypothetical protein
VLTRKYGRSECLIQGVPTRKKKCRRGGSLRRGIYLLFAVGEKLWAAPHPTLSPPSMKPTPPPPVAVIFFSPVCICPSCLDCPAAPPGIAPPTTAACTRTPCNFYSFFLLLFRLLCGLPAPPFNRDEATALLVVMLDPEKSPRSSYLPPFRLCVLCAYVHVCSMSRGVVFFIPCTTSALEFPKLTHIF